MANFRLNELLAADIQCCKLKLVPVSAPTSLDLHECKFAASFEFMVVSHSLPPTTVEIDRSVMNVLMVWWSRKCELIVEAFIVVT